jgi:hypothetical protein
MIERTGMRIIIELVLRGSSLHRRYRGVVEGAR